MANILIGGSPVTSFQSEMAFLPYNVNTTPITPSSTNLYVFDHVTTNFRRIRYLDNATTTGLWYHTGVRETATSFEMQSNVLWDIDYPEEAYLSLANNNKGFQMIWTISNPTWYPLPLVQQYYYCPSVFVELGEAKVDVSTKPPKLIHFDLTIKANSPAFFMPTDQASLTNFVTYIRGRGWSF